MPLEESHDIGESLQRKIENLDSVERAFVHLDYECAHHPSLEHKPLVPIPHRTSVEQTALVPQPNSGSILYGGKHVTVC